MTPGMLFGSSWGPKSTNNPEKTPSKKHSRRNMEFHPKTYPKGCKKRCGSSWNIYFSAKGCFRETHDYSWSVCSKPKLDTFKKHRKSIRRTPKNIPKNASKKWSKKHWLIIQKLLKKPSNAQNNDLQKRCSKNACTKAKYPATGRPAPGWIGRFAHEARGGPGSNILIDI